MGGGGVGVIKPKWSKGPVAPMFGSSTIKNVIRHGFGVADSQ